MTAWICCLLPLLSVSPRDIEVVTLGVKAPPAGLMYAANHLAREIGAEVQVGLEETTQPCLRVGLIEDPLGAEGYAWDLGSADPTLSANTPAGLMYGLLELSERTHDGEETPAAFSSRPLVELRGDVIDLPMYLGCDLYDGRWRWTQEQEASPEMWFHDRAAWTRRFELYAERRVNALLIGHPHPFPAFISYPDSPEAAYFPDDVVARNAETLDWIISEAGAFGVEIYFLTWNEWAPRGWAEAHGVAQEGPGTPESAALNRYSYAEFYRRFPQLGGLVTMAGESPPGCVDFVRENVIEPLAALDQPPHVIFWTWCCYPEDVNYVLEGYPGPTSIMHYLQYEQLFLPRIDPRVGRMSRECADRPVVVLGGPGTATGMLYWGSPAVIRGIMQDVPKENVGGVFFQGLDSWSWVSNKWIGWEALARYHWDPFRDEAAEEQHWQHRIAEVLGDPAFGPPLLQAYEAASDVPMRMLHLTHSQSDVFRPQYGMPLVFYLGMPTLSSYVFENHESIDEQGRLSPRMGLTWPNPDWGIEVASVGELVEAERNGRPQQGVMPLDVAEGLSADADVIEAAVAQLRPLADRSSWSEADFGNLLGVLTMNAQLARYSAEKIRAAVGWERWRTGSADSEECLTHLAASVESFRAYAATTSGLYPQKFGARINVLTKSLPWDHLDLWQNYTFLPEYDFLEFADRYAREYTIIEASMAAGRQELPFALDLVAPLAGETVASLDADGLNGGLKAQSFGEEATASLDGARVSCHFARTHGDFYFPVLSDPQVLPLEIGATYELVFRYEILRLGEEFPLRLSFGARTTEGGWQRDVGARYFSAGVGATGEIRTQFTPEDYSDYYIYISMNGDGDIAIEDLRLVRADEQGE